MGSIVVKQVVGATYDGAACPECGSREGDQGQIRGETGCASCVERYLRSIDAEFLDNYARFGARGRQVVADACLRALVLSDLSDRKLLAITVYEQFVAAAGDFIGLYQALLNRRVEPIVKGVLGFELSTNDTRHFFGSLAGDGPMATMNAIGLPHGEQVPLLASPLDKRERREVRAALSEVVSDFGRLMEFRDVGERALVNAAQRLGAVKTLTDQTRWLSGARLSASQVAALALDRQGRSIEINLLSTDEETLAGVVDGIDVFTRLTRNIIFAFVSLHSPSQFRDGFRSKRQ